MYDPRMRDPRTIYIPPGYGKIRFGRTEVMHIILAVSVLTFAFSAFIYLRTNAVGVLGMGSLAALSYTVVVSFLAVLTGFLLHELMHKFSAQKTGAWAEFRASPFGLLLAIVTALLGFLFAAPGAVYIQGVISRKQNGIISLAGPATNLAIGSVFFLAWLFIPGIPAIVGFALYMVGIVNLFFAVFNLIPIPPFDGSKVAAWNIPIYIAVFGASAFMLLLGLGIIVL